MADVERTLDLWSLEGWAPDVVVIDYADLLAPLNNKDDSRNQINANWIAMSSLRIKLDCCLVTATQSDANSFKTDILDRSNFADDRRKFDHVTAMVGINQKDTEKDDCIQRLNVLAVRDDAFVESRCVHVAGCMATNRPAMFSCV
jgi:replicative DNA helicase